MSIKKIGALLFLSSCLLISCEEEMLSPAEMLVGEWKITSSEILAQIIPGDGSYLRFDACTGSACNGVDYAASDTTMGTFSYLLNEEATVLNITDGSNDGGNYNGDWDILELTDSRLRVVGNTIFGSLKMEMSKK